MLAHLLHRFRLRGLAIIACLLGLIAHAHAGNVEANDLSPSPTPGPGYRVGVLTDNEPFSYRTESGEIEGFAVDLMAAIERVMGLRLRRITGTTAEINPSFRAGNLDILQSYARSEARRDHALFSNHYLRLSGAIFTRTDTKGIHTLEDLRGKRILVHAGSLGETILRSQKFVSEITLVGSVEESLKQLAQGKGDAVLVSRLTGLAATRRLKLVNIVPLNTTIPHYEVYYCFGVRLGQDQLLAEINEGLAELNRTNEFDHLYQKWFGHLEPSGFTRRQLMIAIMAGLTVALVIALWAVVRQRRLRREGERQAVALRASEERYRRVFEASFDGLLVLRPLDGEPNGFIVTEANAAALTTLGRTELPVERPTLAALWHGDARIGQLVASSLETRTSREIPLTLPGAAEAVWLRIAASRLNDEILVVTGDLTRERLAVERLHRTQKFDALGTLAGGIAHDFNNILTGIIGNVELIRLDIPADHPSHENLAAIFKASERAAALSRQILTFSRRATTARHEPVALDALITETLQLLQSTTRSAVAFRYVPAAPPATVYGDQSQLHQVLLNLCTNAVQAISGPGGLVELKVEHITIDEDFAQRHPPIISGPFVKITVRDNGCGMPPAIIDRIFEPFFTTKGPGQGTGLGLAVAHGAIQGHRGTITVYSRPGHGTAFSIYLPLSADAVRPPAELPASPRGDGTRLLFVDDEAPILSAIGRLLEHLGYHVTPCESADEAWRRFSAHPDHFDIVVSDLAMPNVTGLELARRVRERRRDLPFVLTSGFVTPDEQLIAQNLGIHRILEKPLTEAALAQTLHAARQPPG